MWLDNQSDSQELNHQPVCIVWPEAAVHTQLCIKTFHRAVGRLQPSAAPTPADERHMASILQSVVQVVMPHHPIETLERCSAHVILQQTQFGAHIRKVLQQETSVDIHFHVFADGLAWVWFQITSSCRLSVIRCH